MSTEWPLFLHLLGVFLFLGGSLTAAILRVGAIRLANARDQATLLRAVRPAAAVVGIGLVLTVAAGFWLADRINADLGSKWLSSTFGLLGYLIVIGGVAGRRDRKTRELAERLAAEGIDSSPELATALRDRVALVLNATMLIASVAIVALMVWRPS
ncbi:MAG: DUF2269 family protein [Gaiellales bacterium]